MNEAVKKERLRWNKHVLALMRLNSKQRERYLQLKAKYCNYLESYPGLQAKLNGIAEDMAKHPELEQRLKTIATSTQWQLGDWLLK